MILVDQLTKRYGRYTAVDSISFCVRPGTVTGFLGPNGAGKSTTMRMLVGLTPPSSGSCTVLGVPAPLDRVEPATPQEVERQTVPPAGRTRAIRPSRPSSKSPIATKE
jgi:ABC-type multidrug transport system ATPase subunit